MKFSNNTKTAAMTTIMLLAPGAYIVGAAAKSAYDTASSAFRDARGHGPKKEVETVEEKAKKTA